MKILVISNDYPGPDLIYGDVFVHTRLKTYLKYAQVHVIGFNEGLLHDRRFTYEGIEVCVSNDMHVFCQEIRDFNADVITGHLIHHSYIDFLISLRKPMVIFIHGYEATSWKRRLMNYNTIGSIRHLIPYALSNNQQLKKIKQLVQYANSMDNVQFVFVSKWLKNAVEDDTKILIKNAHVIPNGIDTTLFKYQSKELKHRKNILLIRSFKARNYANDIAVEAVLLLSKKPFFNDLKFALYGEGYLFKSLTSKLSHLPNVKLHNNFIENRNIPVIHKNYGIFLCPSRMDTQGVSMCEAMASGLVAVTTPIGGIPEYLKDNISGLTGLNAEEIAARIEYLYNEPDVFLKLSKNASEAIKLNCSLTDTVSKEIELIKSLYT